MNEDIGKYSFKPIKRGATREDKKSSLEANIEMAYEMIGNEFGDKPFNLTQFESALRAEGCSFNQDYIRRTLISRLLFKDLIIKEPKPAEKSGINNKFFKRKIIQKI